MEKLLSMNALFCFVFLPRLVDGYAKKLKSDNPPLQPPHISKIHQKPALHPCRFQITLNLPLVNLCEVRHCLQLYKNRIIHNHIRNKRRIQKLALVIHRKLHLTPNRKAFCRQFLF